MKKQLLFLSVGIVALLASCSPASIASGSYTGNYTTYANNGSGSATVTTVNDNTVNVKISAGGTDYQYDNVTVSKIEAYGVAVVNMSGSNGNATFDGSVTQVSGVKTATFDIDSVSNSGYVHFTSVQ